MQADGEQDWRPLNHIVSMQQNYMNFNFFARFPMISKA